MLSPESSPAPSGTTSSSEPTRDESLARLTRAAIKARVAWGEGGYHEGTKMGAAMIELKEALDSVPDRLQWSYAVADEAEVVISLAQHWVVAENIFESDMQDQDVLDALISIQQARRALEM